MKIEIERGRCIGHGQCEMFAPMIFELDEDGFTRQLREVDVGDLTEVEAVRTAAQRCPERVITLVEEDARDTVQALRDTRRH
jgi:ferredoxin